MKETLKQRFKKALFEFFKPSILEYLEVNKFPFSYQPEQVVHNHTVQNIEFKEIKAEISLVDNEDYRLNNMPVSRLYQNSLNEAKRVLFEEVLKYITVDTSSVMDEHIYPVRKIRVSLFVGKIK